MIVIELLIELNYDSQINLFLWRVIKMSVYKFVQIFILVYYSGFYSTILLFSTYFFPLEYSLCILWYRISRVEFKKSKVHTI